MVGHRYTDIALHLIWSTWDRLPLITPDIELHIYRALHAKCSALKCQPLAIGGVADHVHVLLDLAPTIAIAKVVADLKGSSSHLIAQQVAPDRFFRWQRSYSAFAVCRDARNTVRDYILNQKHHHGLGTIQVALEQRTSES